MCAIPFYETRNFLGLSFVAFPMELQSHCKVVQWVLYNAG